MAQEFYVTINCSTQGKLKPEGAPKPHQEKIAGSYFKLTGATDFGPEFRTPARCKYDPIVFHKELGAASPQLFAAFANHEVLTTVLFEFIRTRPDGGGEVVFQTIKLTRAFVASIEQRTISDSPRDRWLEEVSLVFEAIEMENKLAKTMGQDGVR